MRALAAAATAVALVVAVAGARAGSPAPIVLGGTGPLAESSAALRGLQAYLAWVNARGGVNGHRLAYTALDDAGDPARALAETRRLVEQDGVLAVVGSVGTVQAKAVRGYLNARRVPQLFVDSGGVTFGRDGATYPWTLGFRPSNIAEGLIYGRFVARTRPGARVAVLWSDDSDGRELLSGLRRGVARSKARVVASQRYDPAAAEVDLQVATLRASGADVLALFAAPELADAAYAAARKLGWRPAVLLSPAGTSAAGAVTTSFVKDPFEPRWANDPAMRLYRTILARYEKGASPRDLGHLYGMAVAWTLVELLERGGPEPTRTGLLGLARSMRIPSNPFLLPGIVLRTGKGDGFPLDQAVLRQWTSGRWQTLGGLWRAPST